jgi:tetraacyldisaccharide 4'-kinase
MHSYININLDKVNEVRLIERFWFQPQTISRGLRFILWLTLMPLSWLFRLVATVRRWYFERCKQPSTLPVPVVVVGNISVGGNGKTPVVLHLVKLCQQLKLKVGVVSRGYGGHSAVYPLMLSVSTTAQQAGDEAVMIYQRTQVPVCVGPERVKCVEYLAAQGCNIVISDDGLQHYQMGRALSYAVIDGVRLFGNGQRLPLGPLREPIKRLYELDACIVNGDITLFHQQLPNINPLVMQLNPTDIVNLLTGERVAVEEFLQRNPAIQALAGIGAPTRFFNTLNTLGFRLDKQQGFDDHQAFNLDDFNDFKVELPVVMTEKDAVKCRAFAQPNWWYLQVDASFSATDNTLIKQQIQSVL